MSPEAVALRPARIMVVEDEHLVAMDLSERLVSLGHDVVAVLDTGEAAVKEVDRLQPDLILMDVQLAGDMSGTAAGERIKAKNRVPIVFLTAHSTREIVENARLSTPYAYLLKPFDDRELAINIDFTLARSRIEKERENLILQLQDAHARIDTLSGLLPICSGCHRIRDDKGEWEKIEKYVTAHSAARFSHGLCPECLHRLYPEAE